MFLHISFIKCNNTIVTKKQIFFKDSRRKFIMAASNSSSSNKVNVPEARAALNQFKYEVASEIGVPLKQGYNGDLTSAQNGYVGGYMVKKMIEAQEQQMAGKTTR